MARKVRLDAPLKVKGFVPTPKRPPDAPTGLTATALTVPARVALTWTDHATKETRFEVQRCAGATCTGFVPLQTLSRNTTSTTDPTVVTGATYRYRVRATNSYGNSAWSNVATIAILDAPPTALPAAPTNITATAGDGTVTLAGTVASNVSSYTLKRGLTAGSEASYQTALATPAYVDTSVTNGTRYYYVFVSIDPSGVSSLHSVEVSAVPTATTPPPVPPTAPTLTATAGAGKVDLSWSLVSGATYSVKRSTTAGTEVALGSGYISTKYTDTTVIGGTTYYYVVTATVSPLTSGASNEVTATPTAIVVPPPPDPPPSTPPPTSGNRIVVDGVIVQLQPALDAATFGDTLELSTAQLHTIGAYYSFILRAKTGGTNTAADYITITTSGAASLPASGTRIAPATHGSALAKVRGNGGAPVFTTEPYAHHYKLIGLDISTLGDTSTYTADLIDIGGAGSAPGGYSTRAERIGTHHVTIDRCFVHPAEVTTSQLRSLVDYRTSGRGMGLQGYNLSVINSDIRGFAGYYYGTTTTIDAYGVYVPKPPTDTVLIENNYIETHTMNVFSGGSTSTTLYEGTVSGGTTTSGTFSNVTNLAVNDYVAFQMTNGTYQTAKVSAIVGLVVTYAGLGPTALVSAPAQNGRVAWKGDNITNLTVKRNTIHKLLQAGGRKGWLELKSGVGVLIEGNTFSGEWSTDCALTVRNQDHASPWTVVKDVIIRKNFLNGFSRAFAIAIEDSEATTTPGSNILIENNLGIGDLSDVITHSMIMEGGSGVTIRHNTLIDTGGTNTALFHAVDDTGTFVCKDNILMSGGGRFNCQIAPFTNEACWPGMVKNHNVFINNSGTPDADVQGYNPDDFVASTLAAVGFVNTSTGDYHLAPSSPYHLAGSDSTDIGCDIDALNAALI